MPSDAGIVSESDRPGYYQDAGNLDLWHLCEHGKWRWVNGGAYKFVPTDLVWVDEPSPFC